LNWNKRIRQTHRWLSIIFTVSVVFVTVVVLGQDEPAAWIYLSPLLPLTLLMFSGLYLFVLPYVVKRRNGGRDIRR